MLMVIIMTIQTWTSPSLETINNLMIDVITMMNIKHHHDNHDNHDDHKDHDNDDNDNRQKSHPFHHP